MGVLVTLKNSDRNSSLLDSLSRKSLWMLRSPVARPPDCAHAASSKRARNGRPIGRRVEPLEAWWDREPVFAQTREEEQRNWPRDPRELVPEASSATMVSGNPPRSWTIAPTCQSAI